MINYVFHIAPFLCLINVALLAPKGLLMRNALSGRLQSLKGISDATSTELDRAGNLFAPHGKARGGKRIPCTDILAIYLNSRENRRLANEERINLPLPECGLLLSGICGDHEMIKGMLLFSMLESSIGRLKRGCDSLYSHDLLWYYAEEQERINHLAEYCAEPKRKILLSRV